VGDGLGLEPDRLDRVERPPRDEPGDGADEADDEGEAEPEGSPHGID